MSKVYDGSPLRDVRSSTRDVEVIELDPVKAAENLANELFAFNIRFDN